jgi:hypothetical protein
MVIVGEILPNFLDILVPESENRLRHAMSRTDQNNIPDPRPVMTNAQVSEGWEYPGGVVRLNHTQDIAGIYIQCGGVRQVPACDQCQNPNANPYFVQCRTLPDVQNGACANCVMRHRAGYCSFSKLVTLSGTYAADLLSTRQF